MGRTIQQIRKDLDRIEERVKLIKEDIYKTYTDYLDILTQVVAHHFILACYQVCTQIYPESFLKLSFSQRESLQQQLRKISQDNFQNLLEDSEEQDNINNPVELQEWQKNLENNLENKLEELSKVGNNCLQKVGILPEKIPSRIIEMAIEAEDSIPTIGNVANLLNLLVETGKKDDDDEKNIMKITMLRLRLSDIEFSDSNLTSKRHKLREIKEEINQLEQKYQRQIRELAIAEAEAAWRSSWHL